MVVVDVEATDWLGVPYVVCTIPVGVPAVVFESNRYRLLVEA